MLRRRDGNEVAHRINTAHPARLEDGGESVNPGIGAQPAAIKPLRGLLPTRAMRRMIALATTSRGCEISHRVFTDHKALSVGGRVGTRPHHAPLRTPTAAAPSPPDLATTRSDGIGRIQDRRQLLPALRASAAPSPVATYGLVV